jgi:predicted transcriptional regulator
MFSARLAFGGIITRGRSPMAEEYLDPTDSVAVPRRTAPRPSTLEGKVVTLLDISKAKGDHLLDRLEELLRERARPRAIVRTRKPTFARPAPDPLRQEIVGATDVVIEALAD